LSFSPYSTYSRWGSFLWQYLSYRGIRPPLNSGLMTVLSQPSQFSTFGSSLPSFPNHEWKTEKRHECANMGKVIRLKLWWQLYITWLPERDVRNIRPMDFCSTECTHQLVIYSDDVNILGRSIHTMKESTKALVVARKEIGLAVSSDEIKYVVMSRDKNAGQSHNIKIDNSSFERVEQFKYFRTNLTYQNSFQDESKSRSKSGNYCYCWVQNLFFSS
jgi:hypothetical protein